MAKYTFPKPPDGYRYTILTKIKVRLGFAPDQWFGEEGSVTLVFSSPLSSADEQWLIDLFSNTETLYECSYPSYITTENNCFYIKDIYEWMEEFKTNTGLDFIMWFEASGDPTKKNDLIKLQFSKVLSQQEKKAVEDEYKASFSWGKQ